jgi:benzoyl-CoA-dihydrodiol lyase
VPLLAVLPGTGGLTRLTDKRKVRRDLADVFCTSEEGVRGRKAKDWGLVDHIAPKQSFMDSVRERAAELAREGGRSRDADGVEMTPVAREIVEDGYRYRWVDVSIDSKRRTATITVKGPDADVAADPEAIVGEGMAWWPLAMARDLDDAILMLRTNNHEIGLWLLRTEGDAAKVLAADRALIDNRDHWFVREVIDMLRRTLARIDVSSRSLFALIEEGSCFAGTLFELALAADRSYMLDLPEDEGTPPAIALSEMNFGSLERVDASTRLANRFYGDAEAIGRLRALVGQSLDPGQADDNGLVTFIPDDLDWSDEIRLVVEERTSLSPDALTGMEANLRFGGRETMATRIFGRLSAWQNWIFIRPNAVGAKGALKLFGTGSKAEFDWKRV